MSIHVYPLADLKEHDTTDSGMTCWCCPRVEWGSAEYIYAEALVIHNSADGREAVEQAEEIINRRKDVRNS